MLITLEKLNTQPEADVFTHFYATLSVERWAKAMVDSRPFTSIDSLIDQAEQLWKTANETESLEAFAGHPKIGDVSSLAKKYRNTEAVAAGEQSSVNEASDETLRELSQLNHAYAEKFGFIFIVFATNKTAAEMLALLKGRINNSREEEIKNAAAEQQKITVLRLRKLLS